MGKPLAEWTPDMLHRERAYKRRPTDEGSTFSECIVCGAGTPGGGACLRCVEGEIERRVSAKPTGEE